MVRDETLCIQRHVKLIKLDQTVAKNLLKGKPGNLSCTFEIYCVFETSKIKFNKKCINTHFLIYKLCGLKNRLWFHQIKCSYKASHIKFELYEMEHNYLIF